MWKVSDLFIDKANQESHIRYRLHVVWPSKVDCLQVKRREKDIESVNVVHGDVNHEDVKWLSRRYHSRIFETH